nr:hypothetical protein [Tanacetum cinerariifolium]
MSSYEVIVNGYFGMPIDPLDLYAQLVMEAPPSPDYIPRPEAPPSPDYIPGPEAPHSPYYIPGPEYLEYLSLADDVFPAEEQPLPAAVSPTAELPGYIADSEPNMDPEEEDGDDEESEEDSIYYPTSRGDYDNGDDLSEDDADDEDEEESLDSEDKKEEHLALTVLALALHNMPLRKRARLTTPTGGYEVGESSVASTARQIRPALTVADSRRAEDRLIGRLRSESILVTHIEALQRDVSTLQRQQIDDEDRLTRHIQHEHAQRDAAPEDGDSCL